MRGILSMEKKEMFERWLSNAVEDQDLVQELNGMKENEDAIAESFDRELKFGTAGLRGIIGAGTNRMNIYTVRKATQGLANFLNKKYEHPSVAIAYDSRIKADVFAKEAAKVLAANGVKAYLAAELQPTPVVSYAVRTLKASAGIMVTASHNRAKFNGYKCYGSDGCQMTDVNANAVYDEIQQVDYFNGDIKVADFDEAMRNGLIEWIADSLYDTYLDCVMAQTIRPGICEGSAMKVVYTPLNGAGNKLVRKVLDKTGVKNVIIVPEQELPDGNFTTCPYPNPEEKEALTLGLALCQKEQADLLLATDPDSDRVGIAVRKKDGTYRLMSGNETGILLMNYILSGRREAGTLPEKPVAVRTIVTSKLIDKICADFGCELKVVLTGFKYIGEQILLLEQKNEENRYVFGFEESYGYLAGSYVRDKDAVVASMLICEMAAYYHQQNKTLDDVMNELYQKYDHYLNETRSYEFEGLAGMKTMANIMTALRNTPPTEIAGYTISELADYQESYSKDLTTGATTVITLPKSNVLSYTLSTGGAVIVRPSGTEPKIKIYVTAVGKSHDEAQDIANKTFESITAYANIPTKK